jgi:hypothetical protein
MGRIWAVVPRVVKRRLAAATLASIALPWLAGEFAKSFHQPGLAADPFREMLFIDILVAAVIVFALTMVGTVAFGCAITAAMKGPRHFGDPFPSAHDDDRR